MYVYKNHQGFEFLNGLYENEFDPKTETPLDPKQFDGVSGMVLVSEDRIPQKGYISYLFYVQIHTFNMENAESSSDVLRQLRSPINGLLDIDENYVVW